MKPVVEDAGTTTLERIQRLYAPSQPSIEFEAVLQTLGTLDDATLADAIEADGRQRLLRGEPVDLERYFRAVPDLRQRQDSLDAAIDVTLRCLAGSSHPTANAVEQLLRRYPDLRQDIHDAAMLNAGGSVLSTISAEPQKPPKPLPCEFGPTVLGADGSSVSPTRRYQLQHLLGHGGFGQVYLALDRQLSEEGHTAMVAIKILATVKRSASARQRIIEEATKVRRISHPNVVTVIDRGVTEQDEDYIVYEYVDGGDLTAIVDARPLLPVREAAALMAKIARGVHAAHSAGVIHCDLKPSNIMLTAAREPKVADFGIAIRTEQAAGEQHKEPLAALPHANSPAHHDGWKVSRRPIGTVAFIAPEQYRMEDGGQSIPSDVYALGGIFFLLLTGQLPNGASPEEIAQNHDPVTGRQEAPPVRPLRPEVDRDLEAICRRAMAIKADQRYNSAATFAEDLERWLNREPIAWTRPGPLRVVSLWARRKPALAISVALIILLFITGSAVAVRLMSIANRHAIEAHKSKLTADWQREWRLKSQAIAQSAAKGLRDTLGNYRLATEALTKIWALEYVYGPTVLGLPEENAELWKSRIVNVRNLVQTAHAQGHGEHVETLLWESALGFWLVNDKDYLEAEPLLQANLQKWSRILPADDPWLNDLRSMLTCAAVNRARGEKQSPMDRAELSRLESELLAACDRLPADHRGTPMHCTLLASLIDLYSPDLLGDATRREQTEIAMKELLGKKSRPATDANSPAGSG